MKKNLLYFILCLIGYSGLAQSALYPVPIYSVTSKQTPSSGYEPSKTNDGNTATYYSTPWRGVEIPDELNFTLYSKAQSIKQIVYTPYQGGTQGRWTNVSVYYSKKSQPDVFINIVSNLVWLNDSSDKIINLTTAIQDVAVVRFVVNAAQSSYSTCAEMKFYSEQAYPADVADCTVPNTELQTTNIDTKVAIVANGSFASQYQSTSENIGSSFDGNMSTLYHSPYSGNTIFPVTLNYHFDGNTRIDYLKYYPRTSGWNGWFGKVTIQYNTSSNATFIPLMDYDFGKNGNVTVVKFPNSITPLNIQILVKDGASGYASCAEMEFYTSVNPNDSLIPSGIFANSICSALAPGVTQEQINAISSTFYRNLAQCLFNGTYSKYRVQKYQVYKPTSQVNSELKVNGYDGCENPTGIYFNQGQRVVLFVKNLPVSQSVPLKLFVKNFDEGISGTETSYPLQNGMNIIDITGNGLGYINYYNIDLSLPDVEINIVNGTVNGLYDLKKNSPQEWADLLQSSTYSRIDLVGEYAHVVTRRDYLRNNCPNSVVELISKYDELLRNERMMMGLFKYNKSPKNHILAFCDANFTGLYANSKGVNFEPYTSGYDVTDYTRLAIWGLSHEFGHCNQVRPDIRWIGMTEVTNNIYSTWNQYKIQNAGKYTRLEQSSSSPASGMPSVAGGDINASIIVTKVNNQHFQTITDNFRLLVPFWQLELYYQAAGASRNAPELSLDYPGTYTGVDYARWFATVAEVSRNTNSSSLTNGQLLLNFVKNTCDAVQEDLTDFFKDAGFLKPVDMTVNDYTPGPLQITQAQIDETIASVKGKNYQKPVSPVINYISANSMATYKNKLALSGTAGQGVTLNGTAMVIDNTKWPGAVAFEIVDVDNKLIHVAIVGTGDISLATTKIYFPTNAKTVYAVGYNGVKLPVYPVMDTTAPVITAPANVSVNTDAGKSTASNVTLGTATATDNSGVPTITNNAPATYPIGVTNVIWTATDSSGNTATATQTVTVKDMEAPVITAPANVSVNTDAGKSTASNITLGTATVTDNSGTPTITNNAPATYPVGVTNIIWTARDSAGNTTTATQTVTVTDAEVPVITAPANVAVNTDASLATASNVALGTATATDNSGVVTLTNNAPATYPIGVNNVIWTARDSAGNTATATQTVTVTDTEAPVISAPADQIFSFNSSGTYQVPVLTATDNVNVQSIGYAISGATVRSGTSEDASGQFNVGTSTINWTVTDIYGNTSTAVTSVLVKGPPTLVLSTVADSFVRGGTYGNDNYGTQPTLPVKNGGANYVREAYLKFDLSTLPASFEKATLRLNIASSSATASGTTWQASYVSNDNWTETGITWNNKPGSSTVLQTIPGQSTGWAEWNITSQVLAEVGQDKILTLKIVSTAVDPSSNAAFSSKECSDPALQPQLYVNVYSESARMTAKSEVKVQLDNTAEVNKMVIYPNPTTGYSHLTSSEPIQQIRIINANGQQLFIVSGLSTLEYDINLENLPQGLYFVQVNGNGWQKTEQLIKK